MKKVLLTIICAFLSFYCEGQISSFYPSNVHYGYVEDVEDMTPQEIQMYNQLLPLVKNKKEVAILNVNAVLAQRNLMEAPATLIQLEGFDNITEEDSLPQYLGAKKVAVLIENTTPKTIKEITLYFKFYIGKVQAYNIKDGSEYCVVQFKNIKGRANSNKFSEIQDALLTTLFVGDSRRGTLLKPFYNKKADGYSLDKVAITYDDGSISNEAALFKSNVFENSSLIDDGPLNPYIKAMEKIHAE